MPFHRRRRAAAMAALAAATFAGCSSSHRTADNLDDVASVVAEFGTATVSAPVLVPNQGQFALDYEQPTRAYVDAARTGLQATARRSEERSTNWNTSLNFSGNLTNVFNPLGGGVPKTPATDLAAPTNDAALPTGGTAKGVLSSDRFTAPMQTAAVTGISEREALLLGANDKATEQMLKYLFNPKEGIGDNVHVYLAVFQVSCQPGWRTRQGYYADVGVNVAYFGRKPEKASAEVEGGSGDAGAVQAFSSRVDDPRKSADVDGNKEKIARAATTRPYGGQPLVLSVFPTLDAIAMEDADSLRRQAALANQLGVALSAGPAKAAAQSLFEYARRLETDAKSRALVPKLTAYSNGTNFGFQVRPAFHALDEPASPNAKPGEVLRPATFPAVVLIVCSDEGITQWDSLEFFVNTKWMPADRDRVVWSESDRLKVAKLLDKSYDALGDIKATPEHKLAREELYRRYYYYKGLALGTRLVIPIPQFAHTTIDTKTVKLVTTHGFANAPTLLAVAGSGFLDGDAATVTRAIVGGVSCAVTVVSDHALTIAVPANAFTKSDVARSVDLVTVKGEAPVVSLENGVVFDLNAPSGPAKPTVLISRDAAGHITGFTASTPTTQPHVTEDTLIKATSEILESERPRDDDDGNGED